MLSTLALKHNSNLVLFPTGLFCILFYDFGSDFAYTSTVQIPVV